MALLHRATITPTKGELVAAWLPGRPWAPGEIAAGVSYRLDDPAGEVGMEGFLLSDAAGHTVHVPLTYRGQPLDGADAHLLGTMEHSVLGTRWVYDGCRDPVFAATLAATITTGGTHAEQVIDVGGHLEPRESAVRLQGSGRAGSVPGPVGDLDVRDGDDDTVIACGVGELVVVRRVGADPACPLVLRATWGEHVDVPVAGLRPA